MDGREGRKGGESTRKRMEKTRQRRKTKINSSAALLAGSPLAAPRLLASACSLTCSRASARSRRSLRRGGGGGGRGGCGGAGASLPWAPALGLGLSLVPALPWLLNTGGEEKRRTLSESKTKV
ncbi:hypothetical protein EYF80_003875 [Liparis tanakae]|uniref:Uncharacterized protein n=1 Tax=Liparis tanakae TaxID=230148 RepID=A0A4Z2J7V2_9TELE|nr:hypothetical protein EYF80_003875 [Liparis tanakae]